MASILRRNVRIAAWAAGLAMVAALLWALAPAISLGKYAPEPVNFEQAIPAATELAPGTTRTAAGHGEGPVRFRTDAFAAPKRFDLVGIVDQRSPVELRTRAAGGEWSPWVDVDGGEPVWTGGTDELQLRSRDRRPTGELGYVNVSGDATGTDSALNAVRGAVNAAFLSVASIATPEEAAGDAPFEIVNRNEWDPGHDCVPKEGTVFGKVKAGVVHHTVNPNDYSTADAPRVVLGICRYHRYSNGWNDIGYNALVDRFGNLYAGRTGGLANAVIGAHTAGFNSQTFGVASIGDHRAAGLTPAAIDAITNMLAWKLSLHGVDGVGRTKVLSAGGATNKFPSGTRVSTREVTRHRHFGETECPGRTQISKILKITQQKIASGVFAPTVPGGGVAPE